MKILVTGVGGRIGSAVARELLEHGHEVRGLDRTGFPEDLRDRIERVYCDLTDRLAVMAAADGCDAIAHLAAIPNPTHSEEIITHNNVVGTQYVLAAAEANGIKRVALASSCTVYGLAFAHHQFDPQYLPMDEKHPTLPQDLYGLSKLMNEHTAATYTRRCGMTTVCLRLPMVIRFNTQRARWQAHMLHHGHERRSNDLWTYLEVTDAARAFRLSIEKPLEGHHVLIVAARDSYIAADIREVTRQFYPELASGVENLGPTDSLYDTSLAEATIGFVPEKTWRDVPELREPPK
ncbi:MAG TPA: NAD(P)-dependent oxidoreductase [Abditibacteriaceae bacterium]